MPFFPAAVKFFPDQRHARNSQSKFWGVNLFFWGESDKITLMKRGILAAGVLPEFAPENSARADASVVRETWEAMFSQWPEGPPYETDREKAAAEAAAIAVAIKAANPTPFPDSTEEIRRSRDADWGETDNVDS